MKQKIIGIFVCMLLITTAVSAVNSLKNNMKNTTISNIPLKSMVGSWTETQKLFASDGVVDDNFGWFVSISGDTALIGAWGDDDNGVDSGSAYVFIRSGNNWTQQAKLQASDGSEFDWFGRVVSLDGDTALIGAPCDDDKGDQSGSVYVFTRIGTIWTQQAKLLASDGISGDYFGCSVSLYGNTALIGAFGSGDNCGSAFVFTYTGTTWIQQAKLLASDGAEFDWFGDSVSLYGDTALIGAYSDDDNGNSAGSAYVFIRTGTYWVQQAKLLASDGAAEDEFGRSVSIFGDTAFVGAGLDDDNGVNSGSVFVFTRTGSIWNQQQKLLAIDGKEEDQFGHYTVSIDHDTALIGAEGVDDKGYNAGATYVFTLSGGTWTQQAKLLASDGEEGDAFGCSVSLSGDTALIGACWDDDNGEQSGSTYVFTKVSIPILDLIDIKGGMLGISVVLTNFGEGTAYDIYWEMSALGGLFYPKSKSGTVDELNPGQEEIIKISPVGGFGKATINFYCKYKILNLPYDVDFEVKQEWRNRAIIFLHSFPNKIQPDKQWMEINDYSYFSRSGTPGVEFYYEGINNMHNVRVVLGSDSFSQEIEFIAACKFTDGIGILKECWLTKGLVTGGIAHWELELVDGE